MARAIKKVKVEGQSKHSKLFYIILISIISLVVIGAGIGIGIYVYNTVKDESYDRFEEYSAIKINYDVLQDVVEDGQYDDIFVFIYDEDTFFTLNPNTDEDDIDKYEKDYQTELGNQVENFYNTLKTLQDDEKCTNVAFYLVNASLSSNSGIIGDSLFGGYESTPSFVYIHGESFSSKTKDETEETVSGSGVRNCITCIKEATQYLENIDLI